MTGRGRHFTIFRLLGISRHAELEYYRMSRHNVLLE